MINVMVRATMVVIAGGIAMAAAAQNYSEGYKFLKAVRDRDGETVTSMVEAPGSRVVDSRDPTNGENALQIVVARQDAAWLGFLLAKGANPNMQDDAGNTPLMQAVDAGFADGVRRLISGKANVNLANRSGETPLIRAVQKRDVNMVRLLVTNGADADRRDVIAGMSARDYAARDTRVPMLLKAIEEDKAKPSKGMSGPVL